MLWCWTAKSVLLILVLTVLHLVPSVDYWAWHTLGNRSTTELHPKAIPF